MNYDMAFQTTGSTVIGALLQENQTAVEIQSEVEVVFDTRLSGGLRLMQSSCRAHTESVHWGCYSE